MDTTMTFYARLLVHNPCLVLLIVMVLATICSVIPLITNKLPDFTDPTLVILSISYYKKILVTFIIIIFFHIDRDLKHAVQF